MRVLSVIPSGRFISVACARQAFACALRTDRVAVCFGDPLVSVVPGVTIGGLAPIGNFSIGRGTRRCSAGSFSLFAGATNQMCSGGCAPGVFGGRDVLLRSQCTNVCPPGSWCGGGDREPVPCPAGRFGNTTSNTSPLCNGACNEVGAYCAEGSIAPVPCPPGGTNI